MSNDAQKVPFTRSLNDFAEAKVAAAIFLTGKSLPAKVASVDGQIVTVSFEVNTAYTLPNDFQVPVATSFYRREPIQVGDLGVVRPSDVPLGGITGLGSGIPRFPSTTGSLEALVWEPVANSNWAPSPDPDAYLIQGPNGFVCRDVDGTFSIQGDKNAGTLKMTLGDASITLSSSGVDVEGVLTINGKPYMAHDHQVISVGAPTGPVLP